MENFGCTSQPAITLFHNLNDIYTHLLPGKEQEHTRNGSTVEGRGVSRIAQVTNALSLRKTSVKRGSTMQIHTELIIIVKTLQAV